MHIIAQVNIQVGDCQTEGICCWCRLRAEEEAAAAVIAEAEAALLAEQLAAAAAEVATLAEAEPADEEEQEPLLAQESAAACLVTASLLDQDEPVSEADISSLAAPSIEIVVTSSIAAPPSVLDSFSEELEELLPETSTAAAAETPKQPINAWAKPLTLANGHTPSPWQAATAPTPAEAAHQASAQALGVTMSTGPGKRSLVAQDARADSGADATPGVWDEAVVQAAQPKPQSWQGRQGMQQGPNQGSWRRPPPSDSGDFADGSAPFADSLGLADRGRGRGRGRGRLVHH